MGVVIKQSFWGTFIAYLGVAIGYVNTLYLKPEFFSLDQIGVFSLVTANAMMVSPLCSVGMNGSYIKFFPSFKDSDQLKNQFFSLQLLVIIIANVIILSIAFASRGWIISMFSKGSSEYANYLAITGIIVVVNSLFDQLFAYSSTRLKVIIPSFLREVFLRFGAIVLVVGYALGYFDFEWAIKGLAINYSIVLLLLFVQLGLYEKLRFDFSFSLIDGKWRQKLFSFAWYSMALAVSFAVLNNASYNQVSAYLGDAANGIFVTCFFIGVIVEMPKRNMVRIISPLLSGAMNDGNIKEAENIYKKSSITMAVIGSLLFIGILTNLNDLFSFIPKGEEFSKGFGVVLAACMAKLLIMTSSFSGEIINYSNFYRYNLYFQIGAAALLIVLNHFLIPVFGLNGVAFSYFITIFIQSLFKFGYVWIKFRIHPFMKSHIPLFIVGMIILVAFYYFDAGLPAIANIIIRSVLTTIVFTFLIYKLKISEDINRLVNQILKRILNIG